MMAFKRWRAKVRLKNFFADDSGVAAVELAVVAPLFALVLLGVAGIGGAMSSQFSVERKVRLAIEGVVRFGDDQAAITSFANGSGAAAFNETVASDGVALTLTRYRMCRALGVQTEVTIGGLSPCLKPEIWYKIVAKKSVAGPFGQTLDLHSRADVLAEP